LATTSVQGGSHDIQVYGNGTVFAGNGNDTVDIHGNGLMQVGSGNDVLTENANGTINVGAGSDTISMIGNGAIHQTGVGGHDEIQLGFGNDTIVEQGTAAVTGMFGTATVQGGTLTTVNSGYNVHTLEALSGNATLIGGQYTNQFVAGSGNVVMHGSGALGPDTFIGGSGNDTMIGGANHNLFEITQGGHHVITNFISGQDQLYVEGHTMAYLEANHDITFSGGNTYISLNGGGTTIELKGVSTMHSADIVTKG
jgi:Ca2+-binding RTX toxin-like protein